SRVVFLNGSFLPLEEARIPIMDRGFLFSDGVYEGFGILGGRLVDNDLHLARLERSLSEIRIANPYSRAQWTAFEEELIRRNDFDEGFLYLQVTRGVADRDFNFPDAGDPTIVMFTQVRSIAKSPAADKGIAVITVPD
ncbi:D-amino acid aminotransferase, partial [Corallococcus exiguus]|nr:D-amino acid aminotransferase [Corallococcus exiguus]